MWATIPFPIRNLLLTLLLVAVAWFDNSSLAFSQGTVTPGPILAPGLGTLPSNNYPNQQYYIALEVYREGDLVNAAEGFDSALGQTRKDMNGRWIDAIPVHAMLGECYYQSGDLGAAADQFDAAIALAIRHRGWLSQIDWTGSLKAAVHAPDLAAGWASPNVPGLIPVADQLRLSAGQIDATSALQRGGVFQTAQLISLDAVEIMRGLAIASYRRRVIFGQLSEQTDSIEQLLEATKNPAGLEVPIARALIGSMRTCERFAGAHDDDTLADANRFSLLGGGAHPLSPITMLAAARVTAQRDKYAEAIPMALQAAACASALRQPELVGEAMLIAVGCIDSQNAATVLNSATAAAAAHMRRGPLASAGCMLAAAEAALIMGDANAAQVTLTQANSMLHGRNATQPRLAAHCDYLNAVAAAQNGGSIGLTEPTAVDAALVKMFSFTTGNGPALTRSGVAQRRSGNTTPATPRLFQLGLVTAGARSRGVGGKMVDERIKQYVGEPTNAVWRADPVDAIAYQVFDRSQSITAQIVSAVKRNAPAELLVLIDALHRQRFLATQSLGGRVLQTRRLAATDKTLLSASATAAMLKPPPTMVQMIEILGAPAPLPGTPELSQRGQRLESLATLTALRRGEIPAAAPPAIASDALTLLPKTTGMLMFADVGGTLVAALAVNQKITTWNIPSTKAVGLELAKLMKEAGVASNRSASRLEGESDWKKQASTLRRKLIPDEHLSHLESLTDLIVVPDGLLWYLPLELLPLGDENTELLGDKLAIRYSPTPGLAIHPVAYANYERPTGLVAQSFFAPRDVDANEQSIKQISEALKAFTRLPANPAVPCGLLGESIGPLAVFGIVTPNPATPFAFAPALYDAADPLGSLGAWMRFPSRVPACVFMPGYRTAATVPALGDGRELFLTLTALHCAGVRDVVISRWPVGGESTAILGKEFLQELPFEGVQPAWRRAIQSLRQSPLRPAAEPLLGPKDQEREELTGDHPIFWASYIVDSPQQRAAK